MLTRLHASRILRTACRRYGFAACLLGSLALFSGCASLPPSSSSSVALSGKRLVVTLRFRGSVNLSGYQYFFLINYDKTLGGTGGNQSAPGPVAVLGPLDDTQGYGNGFASGFNGNTNAGFTDFVKFQGNSYSLWHVVPNTNLQTFVPEGSPLNPILPTSSDGNPNTLQFEIDLSQIVVDDHGARLDPTQTVSTAQQIHWLQLNVVATDIVPIDQKTRVFKQVDALGNTSGGQTGFITLDLTQFTTYTNQSFQALGEVSEPSDNDVFTTDGRTGDEALDLIDVTVQVVQK